MKHIYFFIVQQSSSRVKSLKSIVLSIILLSILVILYGFFVFNDPMFIINKYDQRFSIDGKNLDITSEFKEIDLDFNTNMSNRVKIKTLGYGSENKVKQLTIDQGNKTLNYSNVKFTVYSNAPVEIYFTIPSNNPDFKVKFNSTSKGGLRLKKIPTIDGKTIYEIYISNFNSNNTSSFIDLPETKKFFLNLEDSELTIENETSKEQINVTSASIGFTGDRIQFYNLTNIISANINEFGFNENPMIESLIFTDGSGTYALGQSHFQFTPLDEIRILTSGKNDIKFEINPISKTFKASVDVSSLIFNGQENILPNYQIILRDPTFIAAIGGAIVGFLGTIIFSIREKANRCATNLRYEPKRYRSSMNVSNHLKKYLRNR